MPKQASSSHSTAKPQLRRSSPLRCHMKRCSTSESVHLPSPTEPQVSEEHQDVGSSFTNKAIGQNQIGCSGSNETFDQSKWRSRKVAMSNWMRYCRYQCQIHQRLGSFHTHLEQLHMDPQASRIMSLSRCWRHKDKYTASRATTAPF